MDVMFSKLARAYLESPQTFMRVDVDNHGPPLEFARELNLIDKLNSYLNSPSNWSYSPARAYPVSYSVDPDGKAEYEDETSSTPLPLSAHANISSEYSADPTPPYIFPDSRLDHCKYLNCMKSAIPLSKLKGLQDKLDIPEVVEFKCSSCVNCPTCKLSARAKTKSLHEYFEQEVIEKSVRGCGQSQGVCRLAVYQRTC